MRAPLFLSPAAISPRATALRSDAVELNAWLSASPWRTACDRLDAAPRSFDLAVVAGFCVAFAVVRAMAALQRWRRSR